MRFRTRGDIGELIFQLTQQSTGQTEQLRADVQVVTDAFLEYDLEPPHATRNTWEPAKMATETPIWEGGRTTLARRWQAYVEWYELLPFKNKVLFDLGGSIFQGALRANVDVAEVLYQMVLSARRTMEDARLPLYIMGCLDRWSGPRTMDARRIGTPGPRTMDARRIGNAVGWACDVRQVASVDPWWVVLLRPGVHQGTNLFRGLRSSVVERRYKVKAKWKAGEHVEQHPLLDELRQHEMDVGMRCLHEAAQYWNFDVLQLRSFLEQHVYP